MNTEEIVDFLTKTILDAKSKKRIKFTQADINQFLTADAYGKHPVRQLAEELAEVADALRTGRSVFFVLEKYPHGDLSRGRNWYSMYFINQSGKSCRFWPGSDIGAYLVGMDRNERDRNLPLWCFSSRAIGMDRLLDATGTLSWRLKEITGTDYQFTGRNVL